MNNSTTRIGVIGLLFSLWLCAACSGSSNEPCEDGTLGCACYGNDTCNSGMTCDDGLCVTSSEDAGPPDGSDDADVDGGGSEDGDVSDAHPDGATDADSDGPTPIECEPFPQDGHDCPPGQFCSGFGFCETPHPLCPSTWEELATVHAVCDGNDVIVCRDLFSFVNAQGELQHFSTYSGEVRSCGARGRCEDVPYMLLAATDCIGPVQWATCLIDDQERCVFPGDASCFYGVSEDEGCVGAVATNCAPIEGPSLSAYPVSGVLERVDCSASGQVCRETDRRMPSARCYAPDAILCTTDESRCDGNRARDCEAGFYEEIEDCAATGEICWPGCTSRPSGTCQPASTRTCDPTTFEDVCAGATNFESCHPYECRVLVRDCSTVQRFDPETGEMTTVPGHCGTLDGRVGCIPDA